MKQLLSIFSFIIFPALLFSQNNLLRQKQFNTEKNLAIKGYDPVAYFTVNKATKGLSSIAANYEGIIYYFSTVANKNLFIKEPAKYEPQYGGWCAYALGAKNDKVDINPQTFKIINGKLYLFYNAYFNNTLKSWNKDENNLLQKANQNWITILKN
jgi:YHS domain-containing protein